MNPTYQRGSRRLAQVDAAAGEQVIASLADIAPDLARYIIEFAFGEIYCRPGLTLQQRELATIAALTAMGTATPQLKVHIAAGLNVGLSQQQIIETITQMAVYAGFPAALNGVFAAQQVFVAHTVQAHKPLGITAQLRLIDAELREEALIALAKLAQATQLEGGCLMFQVQTDLDCPEQFWLWEQWRDAAALAEHLAAPHTAAYTELHLTELVHYWRSEDIAGYMAER